METKENTYVFESNSAWGSTAQVYFSTDFLLSFKIVLTRLDSHEPARGVDCSTVFFDWLFGYFSRFVNVFLSLETFFLLIDIYCFK